MSSVTSSSNERARSPRRWPIIAIVALYWAITLILRPMELPYMYRWLLSMGLPLLMLIAFGVWWWRTGVISQRERRVGFFLLMLSPLVAGAFIHRSLGWPQAIFIGLPLAMTGLALWAMFKKRSENERLPAGALAAIVLAYLPLMIVRTDGLDANLRFDLHWRWTPTSEERFLAARELRDPILITETLQTIVAQPGDWTEFRGPDRSGAIVAGPIETDWKTHPPKPVWKHALGPAWSSLIVVDGKLYTQEQRGEREALVAYDAATGRELWAYENDARFYEAVSGAGPRATPTFSNGKLYTLGANGTLNCVSASDGKPVWTHDLQTESGAAVPMWGISSSPLAVDGRVITYVGGAGHDNLIAYDAETGRQVWTAPAGNASYASPQLVEVDGVRQILMLSDMGLSAVNPVDGKPLWNAGAKIPEAPRNLQPHVLTDGKILGGALTGMSGLGLLKVAKTNESWNTEELWSSSQMNPEFSEVVVHDGYAYGFDGAIFSCVDLTEGKRKWKGGRYGRGQVIFLKDHGLLLVLTEKSGEVALVAARPDKFEERAKFKAIEGKCWNHPVVAHGKLYVRNAEEMACYDLSKSP